MRRAGCPVAVVTDWIERVDSVLNVTKDVPIPFLPY